MLTRAVIVGPFLSAFVNYFILDMGSESFRYDITYWLPFNANKPIGFFLAVLLLYVADYATVYCFTPIGCVFIGSCWSIITFLKDIAKDLSHLKKRKILNLSTGKLTKHFRNFVRFHADVEELSGLHSSI